MDPARTHALGSAAIDRALASRRSFARGPPPRSRSVSHAPAMAPQPVVLLSGSAAGSGSY